MSVPVMERVNVDGDRRSPCTTQSDRHDVERARAEPTRATILTRAGFARALDELLARYPRAVSEQVLQDAGLAHGELVDPAERIGRRELVDALESGARWTGDPAFGLELAASVSWHDLGILTYLIFNARTVGAAIDNTCRYVSLQETAAHPRLKVDDDEARFVYALDLPDVACHAQHSESILAMVVRLCRAGDPEWTPREVHFKHARPETDATARAFFRCRIIYEQPVDAVVMSRDDLQIALRSANQTFLPSALYKTDTPVTELPTDYDFTSQVARCIVESLSTSDANIEYISARFHQSARTLQRRLRERGIRFRDMVTNIRLELSLRYLSDPSLSLTDIAILLGYSDLSAFSRAFRRWAACSPHELRQRPRR